MGVNITGRSFTKILDYTPAEIQYLVDVAKTFKDMKRNGVPHKYLTGKNIVLLFEKIGRASCRERVWQLVFV